MLIILMLILVVLFAFVQQINNNLYVLYILCLDHFYFAGVPRIIVFFRVLHTHKSLPPAPALAHQELSCASPCCVGSCGSAGLYIQPQLSFFFFFVINNFYFLFFHTQHNRISKIKQNKTADTYSTSQGSIKREGEREGQQEHKSHSFK